MDQNAYNDLARRTSAAWELMRSCGLCPHNCGVNRTAGQAGRCKLGASAHCFRSMIYNKEEQGLNPSHQVYFSGCNLACEFCSVAEWNAQPGHASEMSIDALAADIKAKQVQGAKTLNLLGGEPAVNVHGILQLLQKIACATTVVWNSNMYYSPAVADLLEGVADIYLADFKCGNAHCAKLLLGADDYVAAVRANILRAAATAKVIIRHVVMPGHVDCCARPVLRWIAAHVPSVQVSLKFDYIPPVESAAAPLEYLAEHEAKNVLAFARSLHLDLIQ